jgi:hypothetical protein
METPARRGAPSAPSAPERDRSRTPRAPGSARRSLDAPLANTPLGAAADRAQAVQAQAAAAAHTGGASLASLTCIAHVSARDTADAAALAAAEEASAATHAAAAASAAAEDAAANTAVARACLDSLAQELDLSTDGAAGSSSAPAIEEGVRAAWIDMVEQEAMEEEAVNTLGAALDAADAASALAAATAPQLPDVALEPDAPPSPELRDRNRPKLLMRPRVAGDHWVLAKFQLPPNLDFTENYQV